MSHICPEFGAERAIIPPPQPSEQHGYKLATYSCAHCGKSLTEETKRYNNCHVCANWVCREKFNCKPCPRDPNNMNW